MLGERILHVVWRRCWDKSQTSAKPSEDSRGKVSGSSDESSEKSDDDPSKASEGSLDNKGGKTYQSGHYICSYDYFEDYDHYMDGKEITTSFEPHHEYLEPDDGSGYTDRPQLDLRVLRTCRQLYDECNQVLWTTNRFAFQYADSFWMFVDARTAAQKSRMRKVQIQMDDYVQASADWHTILAPDLIQSLQGLKDLYFTFNWPADENFSPMILEEQVDQTLAYVASGNQLASLIRENSNDFPAFRFRILPLRTVKVMVTTYKNDDKSLGPSNPTLTTKNRREISDHIEKLLLDPGSSDLFLDTQRAANVDILSQIEHRVIESSQVPRRSRWFILDILVCCITRRQCLGDISIAHFKSLELSFGGVRTAT